jgi:hypothetical protein
VADDERHRYGEFVRSADYRAQERDYKLAVSLVVSLLLSQASLSEPEFPLRLSAFFLDELDLTSIGSSEDEVAQVEQATRPLRGVRNAFVNLAGGRFAVNNFIWIPPAVDLGFGERFRGAFADLVVAERPLAERVDAFRDALYGIVR